MGRPAYAGSLEIEISSKWAVFSKHADLCNDLCDEIFFGGVDEEVRGVRGCVC